MSARRFVCEECGGAFTAERSEAEAFEEARRNFGVADPVAAGFAIVCEDCYQAIMRRPEAMLEALHGVNPGAAAALCELVRMLAEGSPEEKAAAKETMRKITAEFAREEA
jgi:hypothetical protein